MTESASKSLLPDGLRDGLPPEAGHESDIHNLMLAAFGARGYERVSPPLVEFEDSLLNGAGEALALSTFRLMDPASQRMMGVRADMTPQIARIATTRLRKVARPLRLSYGGAVLRVRGNQLQPDREFRQAGVELIGSDSSAADSEVILVAYEALKASGAEALSVDLTLPTLVTEICNDLGIDTDTQRQFRVALDRKDPATVTEIGGAAAPVLSALLASVGPADKALKTIDGLTLNDTASAERQRLHDVITTLRREAPDLDITVDAVENRGFEYHSGLSFTFFARGVRGELGCGGRYSAGEADEPATGFSLFVHNLLRALPAPTMPKRLLVPVETGEGMAADLRRQGWITVAALEKPDDLALEAARLNCSHYLAESGPVALNKNGEEE